MSSRIHDDRFLEIIGGIDKLERLGTGFDFTEGPIWHPLEQHLTFSDMPGDHMRRWFPDGRIETYRKPANMANGNTYDGAGRILSCEHATSRVVREEADGTLTIIASHYDGKQLNSPNDIVVRQDGLIFFTDPTFGRMAYYGIERETELTYQGVYCASPDGNTLLCLADDFEQPNGLCFSLDHQTLFVNDTVRKHIRAFTVADDGSATGGDVWVEVTTGEGEGHPDGMKIDSLGNLYCTGPGGVHVFLPDKTLLGVILMQEFTANFAWGGAGLTEMFFTSSTSLYRSRTRTPGLALF